MSVFCEVCLKRVPRSEALMTPQAAAPDVQEGGGQSKSRADSVEPDDTPSA